MSMIQGWTVWCDGKGPKGDCCAMDQISGTKSRAAREFKRSGWKFTRNAGWLCPACVAILPHNDQVDLPPKKSGDSTRDVTGG